jgi:predicted Zn-dependent protease
MFHRIHTHFRAWRGTRPWHEFWLGLPALAACLVAVVLALLHAVNNAGWNNPSQRYLALAVNSLATTNYDTARVASLRGLALAGTEKVRSQWLYYLSRAAEGKGRLKESADLLNAAAPLDRLGSPLAHLAIARNLLTATNLESNAIRLAERHLQIALMSDPQSVEANEMLGRLYINVGDWDKADKSLKQALPMKSELALLLAVVAQGRGDAYSANNWANTAIQTFTRNLKQSAPRENPDDRIGWAQALIMLKDFPAALSVLEEGLRQSGGHPIYRRSLGDLCAAWAGEQAKDGAPDLAERLRLINRGLECIPQHLGLLKLLIDISRQAGPQGEAARASLTRMLVQGDPPALLHFLLGNDAWQRGQLAEARTQMDLAFKAAPQMPYVANNMAMLLTLGTPPELDRALAIIQSVVTNSPDNPEFRDTRGKILLKLRRCQEAITDLEYALPSLKSATSTHKALAEAYQTLGLSQLAEEHLRLAEIPREGSAPAFPLVK